MQYEITRGAQAFWVNNEVGCIGRLGLRGIDVHCDPTEQLTGATKSECLYCTHTHTTQADWPVFQAKMLEHHNVDLSAEPMPEWLPVARTKEGTAPCGHTRVR